MKYAEPPHIFRNLGDGRFTEVTDSLGGVFAKPKVARGAAYADINNTGFLSILMATNGGPAYLYENEGGTNRSLRIKLVGTKSNRDGIGALVHVSAGKDGESQTLHSGSSYLSQNELVLTFGLREHASVDSVDVYWPSGQVDKLTNIGAGQTITVQEGKGLVGARPYAKPGSQMASK